MKQHLNHVTKKKLIHSSKATEFAEQIKALEVEHNTLQRKLPSSSLSFFLWLMLGDVNLVLPTSEEKLKYKTSYENFKKKVVLFLLPVLLFLLVLNLSVFLETIILSTMLWYYLSSTLREHILKMNGSAIKPWWIHHHYISIGMVIVLISWCSQENFREFSFSLWALSFYTAFVGVVQVRYQKARLYTMRAMGQANNMETFMPDTLDAATSPSAKRNLFSLLLPLLLFGHSLQLYVGASCLVNIFWFGGMDWQAAVVGVGFLAIGGGNLWATLGTSYTKRQEGKLKVAAKKIKKDKELQMEKEKEKWLERKRGEKGEKNIQ
jgi:hypothetical protein